MTNRPPFFHTEILTSEKLYCTYVIDHIAIDDMNNNVCSPALWIMPSQRNRRVQCGHVVTSKAFSAFSISKDVRTCHVGLYHFDLSIEIILWAFDYIITIHTLLAEILLREEFRARTRTKFLVGFTLKSCLR